MDFDDFWIRLKQDGVFDMSGRARESTASSRSFALGTLNQVKKKPASGLELVLYETVGLRDGSLANISWLQELPDPVTRLCRDNYLCISPKVH